jgi:hypothetical protein
MLSLSSCNRWIFKNILGCQFESDANDGGLNAHVSPTSIAGQSADTTVEALSTEMDTKPSVLIHVIDLRDYLDFLAGMDFVELAMLVLEAHFSTLFIEHSRPRCSLKSPPSDPQDIS